MGTHAPKVFISYSRDSAEHNQRVLQLANALRNHGIDVELDQYHVRPPRGWAHWCAERLRPEQSDFVLMICTETYLARIENRVHADEGRGVFWEGSLVFSYVYNDKENLRFIPVLLPGSDGRHIPQPLHNHTRYRVEDFSLDSAGYEVLYRELTGQPAVSKPPLGDIVRLPEGEMPSLEIGPALPAREAKTSFPSPRVGLQIAPMRLRHGAGHLFGREEELAALDRIRDDLAKHVLTIVAWGGVGKTSLVVEWMARQAAAGWPGFKRVFDWSFYSQGTREQGPASADTFTAAALEFFGDREMAHSAASPWDKGARLAQLVAQRRTLLVLDGLEPLQHPPGPLAGQLKDPALEVLLKGLAQHNPGLCVVTTRERVADLAPFRDTTAPEWELDHLSVPAGAALLKSLGVQGTDAEFQQLVEDVGGHALTLNLLGSSLVKAHQGDIRKRDLVKPEKADAKLRGGHAFKTMAAYEKWLGEGGNDGRRALAVLRLLGLFDRPADAGCLAALRRAPAIAGLTEPLVGLAEDDWNLTLSSLADCGLISLAREPSAVSPQPSAIDAHPLIREYFAKQLREQNPEAWRSGHRRLYGHLTGSTEHQPDTLEGLQPLYQAVAHGCQAGLYEEACAGVYRDRILRGTQEFYSTKKLGAFGVDLGAVACFFEQPWSRVSPALSEAAQAWLLNQAAFRLRALGRLTEALEPMRAGFQMRVNQEVWTSAAIIASNLSELELTLGRVAGALRDAERSVEFGDRSGDAFERLGKRTTLADALHQAGRRADAVTRFREAEAMQAKRQPQYPLLYSMQGFRYCDLLLAECERSAWQCAISSLSVTDHRQDAAATAIERCREVERRGKKMFEWRAPSDSLLDIALAHLTLGRATLYRAILEESEIRIPQSAIECLTAAVDGLRRAGQQDYIPRGLLSRAWLRFLEGDTERARADLDDAWQIAERGPMRLYMVDIHLHRARLFHGVKPYPWTSPQEDLAAARKLIKDCGYRRRDEELADAEKAALAW